MIDIFAKDFILTVIAAGFVAAVIIVATHIVLATKLTRLQAYVVGVTEVGIVITGWSLLMNQTQTMIVYWGVFGMSGAADVLAWWVRNRLSSHTDEVHDEAFARGQVAGPDQPREVPNAQTD